MTARRIIEELGLNARYPHRVQRGPYGDWATLQAGEWNPLGYYDGEEEEMHPRHKRGWIDVIYDPAQHRDVITTSTQGQGGHTFPDDSQW